ncbi:MAG: trypsin-like serine protease [Planctomycetes bacterium]|nr:trypsin-like serine protease [Planctomycetota bacterium]
MISFSSKSLTITLLVSRRIKPTSHRKIGVLFQMWSRYCVLAISISLVSVQSQSGAQQVDGNEIAKNQAKNLSIAFQNASSKAMKSVVTVLAKRADVDSTLDELDLLDTNSARNFNIGSGVIINETGLCVTNNHVIKDSKGIRVRLGDGRELSGTDLRTDPSSDLATFRIESDSTLPFVTMGNSDRLGVGDWVIAIGSPFALEQTVSVGIISSKGRALNRMVEGQLLQTDAAINPGNSGGALIDLDGELVGINTAIMTTNGAFQGVGFAIPSARVKWITSELVEYGKVRRAKVGLRVERLTQTLADELKLPVRGGVLVTRITADGPAQKAGLEIDDVILEIAQQQVFTPEDFRAVVEQLPADQSYPIKLMRDSEHITLEITPVISDS